MIFFRTLVFSFVFSCLFGLQVFAQIDVGIGLLHGKGSHKIEQLSLTSESSDYFASDVSVFYHFNSQWALEAGLGVSQTFIETANPQIVSNQLIIIEYFFQTEYTFFQWDEDVQTLSFLLGGIAEDILYSFSTVYADSFTETAHSYSISLRTGLGYRFKLGEWGNFLLRYYFDYAILPYYYLEYPTSFLRNTIGLYLTFPLKT